MCNENGSGSADERAERVEILTWLSPLEARIRHDDINAQRVEHVGDWLLLAEEYRNWFDGIRGGEHDNSVLFCYGDPGVGSIKLIHYYVNGDIANQVYSHQQQYNPEVRQLNPPIPSVLNGQGAR